MEILSPSIIDWGVAARTLPGQSDCGDLHVVKPFRDGGLVAAMDGLGHGDEAASAAKIASKILEANPEEPVISLIRRCHDELRGTRGVVMSVASFNVAHGLVTWLGVGNVQGVLLHPSSTAALEEECLLLRAGVVGAQLPPLQAAVLPVSVGDTLIFATDGINNDFTRGLVRNLAPQKAAESILARCGKMTDDALVVVARYVGNRQ